MFELYDTDLGHQVCHDCDVAFLGYPSETLCGTCCDFYTMAQLEDEGVWP